MNFLTKILPESIRPFLGRIVLTLLGFLTAILFLTLGFGKTLLILILTCIGFLLGKWADGALDLSRLPIRNWRK